MGVSPRLFTFLVCLSGFASVQAQTKKPPAKIKKTPANKAKQAPSPFKAKQTKLQVDPANLMPIAPLTTLPLASWPIAPYDGKPYVYGGGTFKQTIILEAPQDGLPPGDVVEVGEISALPPDLGGLLLYVQNTTGALTSPDSFYYKDGINDFVTLRYLNRGQGSHYYHTFSTTLDPKDGVFSIDLFRVFLSKDGKNLFYGGGSQDRTGSLAYFHWNLQKNTVIPLFSGWVGGYEAFNASGSLRALLFFEDTAYARMDKLQLPFGAYGLSGAGLLDIRDTNKQYKPYISPVGDVPPPDSPLYPFWRVASDVVPRTVAWSRDSKLFYTRAGKIAPPPGVKGKGIVSAAQFPSIWVADPRTETSQRVLERGYDAVPSPDGRYLAFFGWSQDAKPTPDKPAPPASLWLYDTRNGKTTQVDDMNAGRVLWTPDSQTLVEVRFNGDFEAHVRAIPLSTALGGPKAVAQLPNNGEVATVTAADPLKVGERGWPQPIEAQSISQNGRYLILDISEYVGQKDPQYIKKNTLRAVDLTSGKTYDIATTKPNTIPFGWQWFDLSNVKSDAPG